MLTAQVEDLSQGLEELKPLLGLHWDKLALYKDKMPLRPQYGVYLERDKLGQVGYVALRDKGKLVGYWVSFINFGLHYGATLTAVQDIWNVLSGYDGGIAPLLLMRAVERQYRRRGVQLSILNDKLHFPCGRLYEAMGYKRVETIWSKWLGE